MAVQTIPGSANEGSNPLPGVTAGMGDVPEELHPLLQWIVDHFKIIAAILVALIIIGIIVFIYDYQKDQAYYETREELGRILVSTSGEERITALKGFLDDDPGDFATQARLELILSLQEAGLEEEVLEQWTMLSDETDMAVAAALGEARALSSLDRNGEALAVLLDVRENAGEAFIIPLARAIAAQAEAAEDWEAALAAYQDLLDAGMRGDTGFYEDKIQMLNDRLGQNG